MKPSHRSFLKRLAALAATVALAQEIAFGRELASELFKALYEIKNTLPHLGEDNYYYVPMSREQAEAWNRTFPKAMASYYHHHQTKPNRSKPSCPSNPNTNQS